LLLPGVVAAIASYLIFFERKTKSQQDMILLDWILYRISFPANKTRFFHVPFDGDCIDDSDTIAEMQRHYFCQKGLQTVMDISPTRWARIRQVSSYSSIMPVDARMGNLNAKMRDDDPRLPALKNSLDYLLGLGEVRATRAVATLVDGASGHANRNDTVDNVYLPISMGYRSCYKRYMASIGHDVSCQPNGAVRVEGKLGKPSDNGYVSFMTYYRMWKSDYPQLKVSRPAEDICQYCFAFSNRHRYLANHESAGVEEGEDDNGEDG
jgi:hypothetical protein